MNVRGELQSRVAVALRSLIADGAFPIDPEEIPALVSLVREAADPKFGDYSATLAMPLAKRLSRPPREVAGAILGRLELGDLCEPPHGPVGPGFINLRLRDDVIAQAVAAAATDDRLGVPTVSSPETIVLDYSSPNVAKPMHVGHIRSTVIGDALTRVLAFRGHRTISDNHLGDWGTQFGMILWGWKRCHDERAFAVDPTAELSRLYRLVRKVADGKPDDLASDPLAGRLSAEHPDCAREVLAETARLHEGDPENRGLGERFMPACLAEIERIYRRLDVTFDHALGESFYQPMLREVVEDLLARRIAVESRGAIGVFLQGPDKPPFLVRKADGAFLYATTDLATIRWRLTNWRPNRILYVVDHRQSQHFQQLFETSRLAGYGECDLVHIGFGTVLGEDGRPFKTRAGDTVGLDSLLDEGVTRAYEVVTTADRERGTCMSEEERRQIAEAVGIGAIKYADLSQNRTTDYVFSFDKMLEMKGNTAAYMQYAVARVEGIFTKGGIQRESVCARAGSIELSDPRERALAMKLLRFSETLEDVEADYRPNVLTTWLFDLAGCYSSLYDALPVLKAEGTVRDGRLVLCDLTGRALRKGLELLGIRVPYRM
ncbi:MAG: arginine--tRNA ligase [Planctomycetaceae bacterium]